MTITPLRSDCHRHLRLGTLPDAAQSARSVHCAIGRSEVELAIADYPLCFLKDAATGGFTLCALFGFEHDRNLFVRSGRWNATYLPAAMLAGPFRLHDDSAEGLGIDEAHGALGTGGEPLFHQDGTPTELLDATRRRLQFLSDDLVEANILTKALADARLIAPLRLLMTYRDGREHLLDGLYTVSRDGLSELDDATIVALHRAGHLSAATTIAASLVNVERLRQLHAATAGDDTIVAIRAPDDPSWPF